jgi:hypothetical protein
LKRTNRRGAKVAEEALSFEEEYSASLCVDLRELRVSAVRLIQEKEVLS